MNNHRDRFCQFYLIYASFKIPFHCIISYVLIHRTPLHCAAFYNDVELCRFLVEHGASVFAMTYSDRQTAAEKCSRLEENYDQCFGFLHGMFDLLHLFIFIFYVIRSTLQHHAGFRVLIS